METSNTTLGTNKSYINNIKSKIIPGFFIIIIIIYIYKTFLKKIIANIIQGKSITASTIKNTITEAFSQYSSLSSSSSLSNTVQFDTNTYLRDSNKPIILNNKIALPVLKYAFVTSGSYENMVGKYFRKNIYPVTQLEIPSNIDAIYKFINNEIDIAFINEELLSRYIKRDCKYLTRILADSFNIDRTINNIDSLDVLDRLYPPINISSIGVGFHIDYYLIVSNFSNIINFLDITNKKVAVLADSYYYYVKLCAAYDNNINPDNAFIEQNIDKLISMFMESQYDAIFVAVHPKNKKILKLHNDMDLRYIHIQKRGDLNSRNNLNNITVDQQGSGNSGIEPPAIQSLNRQAIYSQSLMNDLKTVNIREDFNSKIKKYFQNIKPRSVDLNKFYKSENTFSYLDTYSNRMILMISNNVPDERIKFITRNYIDNLEKMQDSIDIEELGIQMHNFSSLEFEYTELISFDSVIPLAKGAKEVYKDEGLIYYEEDAQCKL
jgi:TRAP-type uncharacterized transport system substrate-binding protein